MPTKHERLAARRLGSEKHKRDSGLARQLKAARNHLLEDYIAGWHNHDRTIGRFAFGLPGLPKLGLSRIIKFPFYALRGVARPLPAAIAVGIVAGGAWAWTLTTPIIVDVHNHLACANVQPIFDANGALIHTISSTVDPDCPFQVVPIRNPGLRDALKRALLVTEGEVAGPLAPAGQDIKGIARKIGSAIHVLSGHRGVTGPAQSAFEVVARQPNSMGYAEKTLYALAGVRYFLTEVTTKNERLNFVLDTLPMVRGGGSYPHSGELGLQTLWGDARPTTLAQICITARAMAFPIAIASGPHGERSATLSWAKALGPSAAQCVTELAPDDNDRQEAMSELEGYCGGTSACTRPMVGLPADLDQQEAQQASEDRMIKGIGAAGGRPGHGAAMRRLPEIANMTLADAANLAPPSFALITTLDTSASRTLDKSLPKGIKAMMTALPKGACFIPSCPADAVPLEFELTVSEITASGPEVRVLATSSHGSVFGPVVTEDGTAALAEPLYGEASIQKILVTLVAAKHGLSDACDGPDGQEPSAVCGTKSSISIAEALARSKPEPFRWLAHRFADDLRVLQDALGATGAELPDAAYGGAYGIGRVLTPAQIHQLLAAIYGSNGIADGLSVFQNQPIGATLDLGKLGYTAGMLAQVKVWLRQPVATGSLKALGRALSDFEILGGKSGTHQEGSKRLKLTAVLVIRRNGHTYIVTSAIWSTRRGLGIGDLKHKNLAQAIRMALEALSS